MLSRAQPQAEPSYLQEVFSLDCVLQGGRPLSNTTCDRTDNSASARADA